MDDQYFAKLNKAFRGLNKLLYALLALVGLMACLEMYSFVRWLHVLGWW